MNDLNRINKEVEKYLAWKSALRTYRDGEFTWDAAFPRVVFEIINEEECESDLQRDMVYEFIGTVWKKVRKEVEALRKRLRS